MKLTRAIKKSELKRDWFIVDASGVRLGKIASEVAKLLIGKHKVSKTTNMDNGDAVIVINSAKLDVYHRKLEQKKYYRHSGYIGNLKVEKLGSLLERKPNLVIEKAVKGMLPKTKLGREMFSNLYVFEGSKHAHESQKPTEIKLK
ncbi:MAG: 50S ribosomal protein L13 [Candidatus Dojkabacteria bacterium]